MGLGTDARNLIVNSDDVSASNPVDMTGSVTATVSVTGPSSNKSIYGHASAVPMSVETLVCQYIIPLGKTFKISGGCATAMVDTEFLFYIDGSISEIRRTNWTERNVDFKQSYGELTAGKIVKITAIHGNSLPQDFDATISGYLV